MTPVLGTPLVLRGQRFDRSRPAVMAIVNRTPDSFHPGNRYSDVQEALAAVDRAVEEGADIVDVGGVRAGQEGATVSAEEEVERVVPFLEQVRAAHPDLVLSLDTWRSEVALAARDAGLDLVNDTWAGHDPRLLDVAAELGAGYVVSHTGGLPPRTDPVAVTYPPEPDGVVDDVVRTLRAGAERALAAGIPAEAVLLDPTLDFGKTTRHSLTLLARTADLVGLGHPVMQAISRKDVVGETLGLPVEERLAGSLAAAAVAAHLGAVCFRTHDVRQTRRALDMVASISGGRPPVATRRGRQGNAR